MENTIIWQQNNPNPENPNNLNIIRQWWAGLSGKKITWKQRIIPPSGDISQLDWEPQRFDETFDITTPELRGITLYWRKPDNPQERNITPSKLQFHPQQQQLYIYPQSQKNLIIRIGQPELIFNKIQINNPQIQYTATGQTPTLIFRDTTQLLEIKISLTSETLQQLKQQIES